MKVSTSKKLYHIKDLAEESGVPVSTVNHYINIGLLKEKEREDNNYRLFTQEQMLRLNKIAELRTAGFSLEQIRRML